MKTEERGTPPALATCCLYAWLNDSSKEGSCSHRSSQGVWHVLSGSEGAPQLPQGQAKQLPQPVRLQGVFSV